MAAEMVLLYVLLVKALYFCNIHDSSGEDADTKLQFINFIPKLKSFLQIKAHYTYVNIHQTP